MAAALPIVFQLFYGNNYGITETMKKETVRLLPSMVLNSSISQSISVNQNLFSTHEICYRAKYIQSTLINLSSVIRFRFGRGFFLVPNYLCEVFCQPPYEKLHCLLPILVTYNLTASKFLFERVFHYLSFHLAEVTW